MYNKFNPRSNEYILYINLYMYSCETGALGNTCFTVHRLYLDYLQKYNWLNAQSNGYITI